MVEEIFVILLALLIGYKYLWHLRKI